MLRIVKIGGKALQDNKQNSPELKTDINPYTEKEVGVLVYSSNFHNNDFLNFGPTLRNTP